jgi:1-acyl-sn-glycerol-3-phosphate acyltransferase
MDAGIEKVMTPAAITRRGPVLLRPDDDGALGHDMSQARPEPSDSWRRLLAGATDLVRRRVSGEQPADESGFDPAFNSNVLMPLAGALYRNWFRVRMRGLEHVPASGPALVVANHSGVLPFDALMLQTGVFHQHPAHRNLRMLGADLVYAVPVLASLARMSGHTRACPQEAERLLRAGELVGVFPEGFKGIGKPFSERYKLQRFGRGGFAVTAIRAGVPIIPCAIVGAEEIYPMIANSEPVARLLNLPYFPVTPLFPWLGPVGAIPLPSNWIIEFCDPVPTDDIRADWQHHPDAVSDLADQVKETIQIRLNKLLVERGPAFG